LISEIRSFRADLNINAETKLKAIIYGGDKTDILLENLEAIKRLANLSEVKIAKKGPAIKSNLRIYQHGIEVYIPVEGVLNIENEIQRISKMLDENSNLLMAVKNKLSNKGFLTKAPKEIIKKEKENKARIESLVQKLKTYKKELEIIKKS